MESSRESEEWKRRGTEDEEAGKRGGKRNETEQKKMNEGSRGRESVSYGSGQVGKGKEVGQ